MTYEERLAEIQAKRDAAKAARVKRDDAEMLGVVGELLLMNEEYYVVRVPDAAAELCGHVVMRPPTSGEFSMFRHTMFRDAKQAGITEARAKAGLQLAAQCRVYPDPEKYAALVDKYPAVADECGKAAYKAAEAGAEAEVKK